MAKTKKWNKVIARIEALEKALASLMTGGRRKKKKAKKKAPKARGRGKARAQPGKSGKAAKPAKPRRPRKPRQVAPVVLPQPPLVSF